MIRAVKQTEKRWVKMSNVMPVIGSSQSTIAKCNFWLNIMRVGKIRKRKNELLSNVVYHGTFDAAIAGRVSAPT
jgi:hypothetical protein